MVHAREPKDALAVGSNSPIAIVQAARAGLGLADQPDLALPGRKFASLKEPSRPFTPADDGRYSNGGSRPPSSNGMFRAFSALDSPRAAHPLPKVDSLTSRSGGGILARVASGSSASKASRAANGFRSQSMELGSTDADSHGSPRSRAGHGGGGQDAGGGGQDDDEWDEGDMGGLCISGAGLSIGGTGLVAPGPTSSPSRPQDAGSLAINGSSYAAGGGGTKPSRASRHSDSHQRRPEQANRADSRPRSHEGPSTSTFASPPTTGEGPDPRRNDDLPARPSTSRGRPSSSSGAPGELPEGGTREQYNGPLPSICGTSGAEVLEMSQHTVDASSCEEDEDSDDLGGVDASARAAEVAQYGTSGPASAESTALALSGPAWDRNKRAGAKQQAPLAPLPTAVRQSSTPPLPPPGRPPRGSSAGPVPLATSAAVAGGDVGSASPLLSPRAVVWKSKVVRGLTKLTGLNPQNDLGPIITTMASLIRRAEEARDNPSEKYLDLLYQPTPESAEMSMRDALSAQVLRFTKTRNAELNLKASRVVLGVVKSVKPMLDASKLLRLLSYDRDNDARFVKEGLLQPIRHALQLLLLWAPQSKNPAAVHEAMVDLLMCLKNITVSDDAQQLLVDPLGVLHVARQVLEYVLTQKDSVPAAHVAVQLMGLLRNLAVPHHHAPYFVAAGLLPVIRRTADVLSANVKLVYNVVRVLSKLSLHPDCQLEMERDGQYAGVLVNLLVVHNNHGHIIHRLTFTLGNLTTSSLTFCGAIKDVAGAPQHIVDTLSHYTDDPDAGRDGFIASVSNGGAEGDGGSSSAAVPAGGTRPNSGERKAATAAAAEDVKARENCLVKLLRLVANLATHNELGEWLSSREEVAVSAMSLLAEFSLGPSEELVLNCVSALTNLSFYHTPTNKVLQIEPRELLRYVTPLLGSPNDEAKVEAARLCGNLSRSPDVCACMAKDDSYVLRFLVTLLSATNREVLHSVVGTLINFSLDSVRKQQLVKLSIVSHLIHVLELPIELPTPTDDAVGHANDLALVTVVVKALFNICADDAAPGNSSDSSSSLTDDEAHDLLVVLGRTREVAAAWSMEVREQVLEVVNRLYDAVELAMPHAVPT